MDSKASSGVTVLGLGGVEGGRDGKSMEYGDCANGLLL